MTRALISTSEFTRDFEAHTARMLRPRFKWFLGSLGALYLFLLALIGVKIATAMFAPLMVGRQVSGSVTDGFWGGTTGAWIMAGLIAMDIVLYIWCWRNVVKRSMGRDELVRFTQFYLVFRGIIEIAMCIMMKSTGFPWAIMLYHAMACGFLPWTPMQAIKPIGPLLVLNAIAVLVFRDSDAMVKSIIVGFSLFAAAPGIGIAALKQSRRMAGFRVQMLQSRYGQMRRELVDARRIHEALFPAPINSGPVHLDYRYEPMRQIGGDYLYARFAPCEHGSERSGKFNVLLLDVTGHGIAAALTVNRLYGEVERLFAENPHVGPGEVLGALNKYVHLTLANHSIYATALCMRIDHSADELEYASGGHPPAFLCTSNGKIDQLTSTAFVLGAAAAADFDPNVQRIHFAPGDRVLAYTDGAIEARNDTGRMIGVFGMLKILAGCTKAGVGQDGSGGGGCAGLSATILSSVESHRFGMAEDDTLVVEIARTVAPPSPGPPGAHIHAHPPHHTHAPQTRHAASV